MTKQHLEQVVESINQDQNFVSEEEERVVEEFFRQFSGGVQQINRSVSAGEIVSLIASFKKTLPYLKYAEVLVYPPQGMKRFVAKPYKNFEVTFQNATVLLGRMSKQWVFYYNCTIT